MANKFVKNNQGFNELRNSSQVMMVLADHCGPIRTAADSLADDPGGFEAEVVYRPTRAVGFVRATSPKAVAMCRSKNVLLKAVRS